MINLAEQLKLPFMQIQRQAELIRLTGKQDISSIETSADYALKLIDNYLLGLKLNNEKLALEQEPVSVAAVLYDSGQLLDRLAKKYGVKLELNISGKYEPVMAHKQGLESALVSLGTSLIEAAGVQNTPNVHCSWPPTGAATVLLPASIQIIRDYLPISFVREES